ncbi:MAG: DUF5050 domain-containing protein [Lachnospiraceae bacterium]|nr:DUF5050 domain-containing protein [Lachnospiraceae bacterium]
MEELSRKPDSKRLALLILVIVVIILAIATVISYFSKRIPKNPPGTVGNSSGNLNNQGLFVEDKGEIYFINPYDNNYIYRMNLDGTGAELFMDVPASYLNSAGSYLYFNQQSSDSATVFGLAGNMHGIYRKKKTGGKAVNGIERAVAGVAVLIDNTIFFQHGDDVDGTTLHRADIDGKNKEVVTKSFVNPACVINGQIYFPDYDNMHYLSVLNAETGLSQVFIRERVHNPTYSDNYIYYMSVDNDYALYRYNISANTIERVTEDRVDAFNLIGNFIYYQKNSATEPMLIRMHRDGTGSEIIANGIYMNINTTSYYTYFQDYLDPGKLYRVANADGSLMEQFMP